MIVYTRHTRVGQPDASTRGIFDGQRQKKISEMTADVTALFRAARSKAKSLQKPMF